MTASRFSLVALGTLLPLLTARADLNGGLIAYYNFDAEGTAGIANQIDSGASHNGQYGSGTTYDITPPSGTGAGFAGDATFAGADATSTTDRSIMLVGKALNVAKDDVSATAGAGWFHVPTLGASTLGTNFAVSAWFYLAPDEDNTGTIGDILRDYVFESADAENFDVSFGTNDANGNTYVSWIGGTSGAQNAGTLVTGQWHHVVHVFAQNGPNTTLSVYVNGVKVGNTVSTATANMNFTSLNFGAARVGMRVFDGMLDEVGVWNRSLTANEVTELYQRGQQSLAITSDLATVGKAFASVETSDPAMGRVFGTGIYNINDTALIEAEPNPGHLLSDWAAPFSGQPQVFNHIITGPVTITANFAQDTGDDDADGLTNYEELVVYRTEPDNPDTDGDLLSDFAEVRNTLTDPLGSQIGAVNYIMENLGSGAGPNDTVLARNTENNTLTLKLKARASTTLVGWNPLTPSTPGASAGQGGGKFLLQLPATSDTKRFFQVEGLEP